MEEDRGSWGRRGRERRVGGGGGEGEEREKEKGGRKRIEGVGERGRHIKRRCARKKTSNGFSWKQIGQPSRLNSKHNKAFMTMTIR